jgi:hypothetical protein
MEKEAKDRERGERGRQGLETEAQRDRAGKTLM